MSYKLLYLLYLLSSCFFSINGCVLSILFLFKVKVVFKNLRIIKIHYLYIPFIYVLLCYRAFQAIFSFFFGYAFFDVRVSIKTLFQLNKLKLNGGIILTAHYHNWEIGGGYLTKTLGLKLKAITQPLNSFFWNKIINKQRKRNNLLIVNDNVSRETLSWLKNGNVVAFLLDQFNYKGVKMFFFNREIRVNRLPMYMHSVLLKPCYMVFIYKDELKIICLSKTNVKSISPLLYRRYFKILEVLIQKEPFNWLGCFHNLFKLN